VKGSLLRPFITGARAVLAAQLVLCVFAVALSGWALGVTGELLRERNRLQERIIQLEEAMAARGQTPPAPTAVVERAPPAREARAYPGSIATAAEVAIASRGDAAPLPNGGQRNIAGMLSDFFGPAEPLQTIVFHVRAREDLAQAETIALHLYGDGDLRILTSVMPPQDTRQSGYVYFDGRQSRAAAEFVTRFHDTARQQDIAPWAAQLRGAALPSQGEYSANRLDIILPALPPPAPAIVTAPPAPPQ
jgi:hypothetical protein